MAEQRQFLNVIDLDKAQQRFRSELDLRPLGEELVELSAALGRVVASDVCAEINVPSFDRSNFDGYAVLARDTVQSSEDRPVTLELLPGHISTGRQPQREIKPGQAIRISTGAIIPRGADAVVMVEDTDECEQTLEIRRSLAAGFGVSFTGSDIAAGECVIQGGVELTSRETGVLAAIGRERISVRRSPIVAIISTGDEIIPPSEPMVAGMVYDSNARILSDAVREVGGQPLELGIAIDDLVQLEQLVERGLNEADIVILSGGTSKGEGDLSYRIVEGFTDPGIIVHGVALKPGKPVCLAATRGKPLVVLPGFPTSAVFTFHEFVAPIIRELAGRPAAKSATVNAELSVRVNSDSGRTEYLLVGLIENRTSAHPTMEAPPLPPAPYIAFPMGKGSGSVTTFSQADGFITIDRHESFVEAGSQQLVTLISKDLRPADLVSIGSHCPGFEFLSQQLRTQGFAVKQLSVGSSAGLEAIRSGQGDIAGIHLLEPNSGSYNTPFLSAGLELISGYGRRQGVVFRNDDARLSNRLGEIGRAPQQLADVLRSDKSLMMINRNGGSGTRILIDQLLGGHRPPGYSVQAKNHHAVVAAIAQGRADWGIAVKYAANDWPVTFVELFEERFDFVIDRRRPVRPAVAALQTLLADAKTRDALTAMGFIC